jgi:hypothetical protein
LSVVPAGPADEFQAGGKARAEEWPRARSLAGALDRLLQVAVLG